MALSALPAVWVGYRPSRIAESLADELVAALRLDFVFLRLKDEAQDAPLEILRTSPRAKGSEGIADLRRRLAPFLEARERGAAVSIPNPIEIGSLQVVFLRFGHGAKADVLAAGSVRADFPSEIDRLLLSVAANQAAVVFEQKRSEIALRGNEERYRSLVAATTSIVWTSDADGNFVTPQPSWEAYTGRPWEAHRGWGWLEAVHPEDRETLRAAWASRKQVFEARGRLWHAATGSYRHFVARAAPVLEPNGSLREWVGTVADIHERRVAEEALRQSDERYRLAARAANDAIWDWNLITDHVDWNEGVLERFGYAEGEVKPDASWRHEGIHPEDRERVVSGLKAVIGSGGQSWSDEYRFRRRDGSYAIVLDRGFVLRDETGRPIRMTGAMLDLTDRKELEESLRRQTQQLEDLDRRKDEFLAMLAHELRNPLAPIRNALQHHEAAAVPTTA